MNDTYFIWEMYADESVVKVFAWTEEQALQKAEQLLPGRNNYKVAAVLEYEIQRSAEKLAEATAKFAEAMKEQAEGKGE